LKNGIVKAVIMAAGTSWSKFRPHIFKKANEEKKTHLWPETLAQKERGGHQTRKSRNLTNCGKKYIYSFLVEMQHTKAGLYEKLMQSLFYLTQPENIGRSWQHCGRPEASLYTQEPDEWPKMDHLLWGGGRGGQECYTSRC
jgi:hypothetical protein